MTIRPLFIAALLATAPALAATPIDQTRPLAPTGQVSVDNLKGRIVVRGWDRPEVKLTGSLGEGVEKLEITGDANDLRIVVRYPKRGGGWFGWGGNDGGAEPTQLELRVPRGASLSVDSVSADVEVSEVAGRKLSVDSVSGDVRARAVKPGEASFDSVSGDLDLEVDSRNVRVDSISGDIVLKGRLTGQISLETVSGDALVVAGMVDRLALSTVSGDGQLTAGMTASASILADSVSGDLTLDLPADTSARLRVETFSGGISSPVGKVRTEEYGPGKHLDARLGEGGGDIRLESFSGDVRIRLN
ncbi:DUF4097 family beta strand repeat-containing protein [Arenimonas sp. MALMAid1274]|uniref:DUF4097 family beta strand repeat-containing protein n=1 Tax=Arenimonas sp. MALMAid1274 TaxID=3411630 RepID=UPI003B9E48FC